MIIIIILLLLLKSPCRVIVYNWRIWRFCRNDLYSPEQTAENLAKFTLSPVFRAQPGMRKVRITF